jgi:hypothetical protein
MAKGASLAFTLNVWLNALPTTISVSTPPPRSTLSAPLMSA